MPAPAYYCVVRITSKQGRDEWTNLGVMVFSKSGERIFSKRASLERAMARGDVPASRTLVDIDCLVDHFLQRFRSLEEVEAILRSEGHYMGWVQLTEPRPMRLEDSEQERQRDFEALFGDMCV